MSCLAALCSDFSTYNNLQGRKKEEAGTGTGTGTTCFGIGMRGEKLKRKAKKWSSWVSGQYRRNQGGQRRKDKGGRGSFQ